MNKLLLQLRYCLLALTGILFLTTAGTVETVNTHTPVTPPNQVRMATNTDNQAQLMIISPKVKNFDSNWLRFYGKMILGSHSEDVIIGYTSSRENMESFVAVDTLTVSGTTYKHYGVAFSEVLSDTDEYHIGIKFVAQNTSRSLFVDNIKWEVIPAEAVAIFDREEIDFFQAQVGTVTEYQPVTITNDGFIPFSLSNNEITISGPDVAAFSVEDIDGVINLSHGESIVINVRFAPTEVKNYQATLTVHGSTLPLKGAGANELISDLPYFQDFNSIVAPMLPFGWKSIVDNPGYSGAAVQTSTATSPLSPPNHAQILSNNAADAKVMLISPPVANLQNTRLQFWAKCNTGTSIPDLIVGTMTNPEDATTFVPYQTITAGTELTSAYKHFVVYFDTTVENHPYIAFKHGVTPNFNRSIFIDNFLLDAPTGPIVVINPDPFVFPPQQFNTTSVPYQVEIKNDGIGTLVLSASDISIFGYHSAYFTLHNLETEVSLEPFQTTTISISFFPLSVGEKTATLKIKEFEFAINGLAIDATISVTPHFENFDNVAPPTLPPGWTGIVINPTHALAVVQTTTSFVPFSPPNQARIFSNYDLDAHVMLITPPVENLNERVISFWAKANLATSIPHLLIGTMSNPSDQNTFTLLTTFEAETDITEVFQRFTVSMENAPEGHAHIAFKHGGTPTGNRAILIDDFLLTSLAGPYIIEFNVVSQDGSPVENAVITLGEVTNEAGNYTFIDIPEGIYDFSVSAEYYHTLNVQDLVVNQNATITAELNAFTFDVNFLVKNSGGLDIENAVITLGSITNNPGDYIFNDVPYGVYGYHVSAPGYIDVSAAGIVINEDITFDIEMEEAYTVTFNVMNQDNNPVTSAVISFGGTVNQAGDYTFTGIAAGNYNFTITANAFIPYQGNIEITQSTNIDINLDSDPEFMITSSNISQHLPVVAFNGDNFLTVYTDRRSNGYSYYSRFVDEGGNISEEISTVEMHAVTTLMHSIARGHNNYLFTWSRQRFPWDYRRDAFAVIIGDDGEPVSGLIQVSSDEVEHSPSFMRVAFDGVNYLVIWQDGSPMQNARILAQFVSAKTHALVGDNFVIRPGSIGSEPAQVYPDILFDGTNYLVTWDDNRTGERSVYGVFVDTDGNLFGDDFVIAGQSHRQMLARVAYNGSKYMAVFSDRRHGAKSSVYGQMFDAQGNLSGPEILLSQMQNNFGREYPKIGSNGNQFLVAWEQEETNNNSLHSSVWGRMINSDGSYYSDEFTISKHQFSQREAEIDAKEDKFLVVWQDSRVNGTFFNIHGRFVDAVAPAPKPAPVNLQAVVHDGSVELVWQAPSESVLHYRVYRDYRLIATNVGGTAFEDLDVEPATTYFYYVTAIYEHGQSAASNIVAVEIPVQTFSVTFSVRTPSGTGSVAVQGATVELEDQGELITNQDGIAVFHNIEKGVSLDYFVIKDGYFPISGIIQDVTENLTVDVELTLDNTAVDDAGKIAGIIISPNPVSSLLNISSKELINSVFVADITGRVVLSFNKLESNFQQVDVSGLPNGMYMIRIVDKSLNEKTLRFLKQ
jgi:hypothetical protein